MWLVHKIWTFISRIHCFKIKMHKKKEFITAFYLDNTTIPLPQFVLGLKMNDEYYLNIIIWFKKEIVSNKKLSKPSGILISKRHNMNKWFVNNIEICIQCISIHPNTIIAHYCLTKTYTVCAICNLYTSKYVCTQNDWVQVFDGIFLIFGRKPEYRIMRS